MPSFALYHHVGSGNKGCEALVKTTSEILCRSFGDSDIRLFSTRPEEDQTSDYPHITDICGISFDEANLPKPPGFADRLQIKLRARRSAFAADEYYYSKFYDCLPLYEDRIYLSVGGDTYCYGDNSSMQAFNLALKKRNKKTILWGCSLDESSFSAYNTKSLRTFDAIFARESGTFRLLKSKGFTENVFLHPDPAFTLEPEYLPLPDGFAEGNTIGINASPLVFKYEQGSGKGIGLRAYERLIERILHETDCGILLLAHVFWQSSDDRTVLEALYKKNKDTGRIALLREKYSASQLKGFIARCRAFIGARTHSTIAAYSTCVPTLVLGYSVKSVNIANDLFGQTDGFVVPIERLTDENGLADAFMRLLRDERQHRAILQERMPQVIADAYRAGDTLREFLR